MTTYYGTRSKAEAASEVISGADDRILWAKVELEPYNGWVVILAAKPMRLDDLAEQGFEIDVLGRRTRDPEKVKPQRVTAMPTVGSPTSARSEPKVGGVSQRVWQLCRELNGDRKAVISAAIAEGINDKTAATQYSRWKRAET